MTWRKAHPTAANIRILTFKSSRGEIEGVKKKLGKANLEEGFCILCGAQKQGVPARQDFAISSFRKARELLRLPAHHAVACEKCLPLCIEKRKAFEKRQKNYQMGAGIFFILVFAGSLAFRRFDLGLFVPAILGAVIILLLPYGYYSPKFEISERK